MTPRQQSSTQPPLLAYQPDHRSHTRPLRAAEFFAGVGLVRSGLEEAGFEVVWANDIKSTKLAVHAANFEASHYRLDDVRNIEGSTIPSVDLAAASFTCG
ncbi:MAG: DNA cytosine methyltransferase, partial [Acidimicrobiaceae bacterium]|nr:DNA cytosine methyltransferase [Acidimicrobiaceae bacterium]